MTLGSSVWLPAKAEADGQEQSALLTGEVAAGEQHTTRLRNLPRGADLDVELTTDGELRILVLNEDQFTMLPGQVQPLVTGTGDRRIGFQLVIPASGTYFLVVDNSGSSESRAFTLSVRARVSGTGDDRSGQTGVPRDQAGTLQELERFQSNLQQTFVFSELTFRISECGAQQPSDDPTTVTFCTDIGPLALQRLGDPGKASDVVSFIMLREVGRSLLKQWEYSSPLGEDDVDQFAIVLFVMYGQAERLARVVEFFETFEADRGETSAGAIDVPPQRLQNLKRWLSDPDLVRQWQPFVVRHLQTETLRVLARHPRDWTDVKAIEQELARR
ncbi:hypothetical protein [Pararhodobacter sp. SW119]|uniref:hypothetical protein n=1 Tax=Pararhodobacter sp. SW119 TaxID=2780075 RepID=UPI001AE0E06B|nr:hypothetical protein [Pararhodobacter sp. SW119]